MLNTEQKEQLGHLVKFFTYVMEKKVKGKFMISASGNGYLGTQVKYEGYYALPRAIDEEELSRILLK